MSFLLILIVGLILLPLILVTAVAGVVLAATSPEFRAASKRAATAVIATVAPLTLVAVGMVVFFKASASTKTPAHVAVEQPALHALQSEHDSTLAPVDMNRVNARSTAQHAGSIETATFPIWLIGAVMLLVLGGTLLSARTNRIRWLVVPAVGLMLVAWSASVVTVRQEVSEAQHRNAAQARLQSIGEQMHAQSSADDRITEREKSARLSAESATIPPDGVISAGESASEAVTAEPLAPVSITLYVGETTPGKAVEQLPDWVAEEPQFDLDADTERFVLRSARYSTVEEAESELLQKLQRPLNLYLAQGGISLDLSGLSLTDVQRAHIRTSRVVEQFDLPLLSTIEPMYRVTWQVWLRPVVRDALGADYRLAIRDQRLWQLSLGLGLLTLLFGTWAAYFRIDDNTQGRYRSQLRLAAVGASLAQAAVLFVA